jgi:hypothetical protein
LLLHRVEVVDHARPICSPVSGNHVLIIARRSWPDNVRVRNGCRFWSWPDLHARPASSLLRSMSARDSADATLPTPSLLARVKTRTSAPVGRGSTSTTGAASTRLWGRPRTSENGDACLRRSFVCGLPAVLHNVHRSRQPSRSLGGRRCPIRNTPF